MGHVILSLTRLKEDLLYEYVSEATNGQPPVIITVLIIFCWSLFRPRIRHLSNRKEHHKLQIQSPTWKASSLYLGGYFEPIYGLL